MRQETFRKIKNLYILLLNNNNNKIVVKNNQLFFIFQHLIVVNVGFHWKEIKSYFKFTGH